jgi:myo-inositol-1(or 4)-monophosphatase
VVLDPVHDECFSATRSGPAKLNGEDIAVEQRATDLGLAMIATGFDYDASVRARQGPVVSRVLPRVRDIRRAGVAAIDLCWCACGRYDAYYERGPKLWDVAAGRLIAERAGLIVRELRASGEDPAGLVAGPEGLVEELVELVSG